MSHFAQACDRLPRRFLFLALVVLVPCASPSVAESVLLFGAEKEAACEDCQECLAHSEVHRLRKRNHSNWSLPVDCFADGAIQVQRTADPFVSAGHRLSNGLLAPLTC